ncbi:hypothetical protein [Flavobacterium commune]|uniref:Uncharacterized protein n=1 Tax=Flavobacterium commune TaxID=1306519 RepID=A0A1D9PCG2_9FLAO|nr:hypothetical protein [Flavobacterium commune]APA00223.1 hypothetical protein BIW12_12730 [Flavobacterium commune]
MIKPFIEIDASNFIIHPFEINKPDDYNFPVEYPNCCNAHKINLKRLENFFELFPNCCEKHLSSYKKFNFDKNTLYKNLPTRILKTVDYTNHQIIKTIDNTDWFEDISDYFELAITSLGQPAVGYHIYVELVEAFIKSKKNKIPANKKKVLLNYFVEQSNYTPKNEETSLKLLFEIYQKWLRFFPFELPFFTPLKPKFEKTLPFVKGKHKTNRYLGRTTLQMVTPSELVDSLYKKTLEILSLIETTILVKEGKITDTEKLKFDFINQNHQHRQKTLLNTFNKGEKKYIKTIKEWLENEKEYFTSITPLASQKTLKTTSIIEAPKVFKLKGLQASIKDKATNLHYALVTKQYLNEESKKDFLKLFTGKQPETKISWLGQKGELKSFIDYLLSLGKIENCQTNKWQITSVNFKFGNEDFKPDTIKDTKKPKNDIKLKYIVQNIG